MRHGDPLPLAAGARAVYRAAGAAGARGALRAGPFGASTPPARPARSTYSYGSAAAGCAPCPAPATTPVSPSLGCAPAAGAASGPLDSLALYLSGSQAEGVAALGVAGAGLGTGYGFGAAHLSAAGATGAIYALASTNVFSTPALPQLPTGAAPRSLTAWVRCQPPTNPAGAVIMELGGAAAGAAGGERFSLVGLNAALGVGAVAVATPTWTSSLIAGAGTLGNVDGPAATAVFAKIALAIPDGAGGLFIADQGNFNIRRLSGATGAVSTIVGTGVAGFTADGQAGTSTAISSNLWASR